MGDGALKIMQVFKQRGIAVSGIFASDDFVRGHSFEGFRVHKLSGIEDAVDDFVVVLAVAAGYQEIVDKIHDIASRHTLYVSTARSMRSRYRRYLTALPMIIHARYTQISSISRSAERSSISAR